jgi:hypothetical protein
MTYTVIAILLLATSLHADVQHSAADRGVLELTLAPERPAYLVGEPVKLVLSISNRGDKVIEGRFHLLDFDEALSLYYRRPGASFQQIPRRADRGADYSVDRVRVAPGEQARSGKTILLDPTTGRLLMGSAGDYEFYVAGRPLTGEADVPVRSATAHVTIEEAPSDQREAYDEYIAHELYRFVGGAMSTLDRKASANAAQFLERFPRARYAAAVKEALLQVLVSRILYGAADDADRTLYERLKKADSSS